MSTLHQLREGLHEAWDNLLDGWQRLYRRAAGAITKFTPGAHGRDDLGVSTGRDMAMRSVGWGVLAAEVFDDESKVTVRLEAPGMERDDFSLEVLDRYLIVSGEKHLEHAHTEGRYRVTECAYGRFERAIPIPEEVDTSRAEASYKNGVLRVELPKVSEGRRRRIKVEIG